jgi:porin
MQRVLATGGVVAALVAVPSLTQAQAINSGVGIGPSLQVAQPSAETNVAPTVEHLFGDVGGVRTKLEDHSIYLLLDATTEFASNVSGGVKRIGSVWPG